MTSQRASPRSGRAGRRPSRAADNGDDEMSTTAPPVARAMVIDGDDVEALSGERFSRESPAHDTVVSTYPQAAPEDVDRAVTAARRAFDEGPWPRLPGAERARVLIRVAELVRRDADELARLEALESGKP